LKSFFSQIGGNDSASLMTVQIENGSPTLSVLGPFTNDGAAYVDSLHRLTRPETSQPAVLESLRESIRLAATADDLGLPDVERHVLVLGAPDLTVSEVQEIVEYARASGVHISSISHPLWPFRYGLPEAALRTGGFVSHIHDPRQLGIVFGVLDRLLAGTLPSYRM
jgi:hypothetical protein